MKIAGEVQIEECLPLVGTDVQERAVLDHGRVADDHVDPPMAAEHFGTWRRSRAGCRRRSRDTRWCRCRFGWPGDGRPFFQGLSAGHDDSCPFLAESAAGGPAMSPYPAVTTITLPATRPEAVFQGRAACWQSICLGPGRAQFFQGAAFGFRYDKKRKKRPAAKRRNQSRRPWPGSRSPFRPRQPGEENKWPSGRRRPDAHGRDGHRFAAQTIGEYLRHDQPGHGGHAER